MRSLLTATLTIAVLATPTVAQDSPAPREGFWFNVGLGVGSTGIECAACGSTDRSSGFSGNLRLGGTINPQLLWGVGTNGWTKSEDGADGTIGALSGLLVFYPSQSTDFWMQGGLGVMRLTVDGYDPSVGNLTVSSTSFSVIFGVGYDIRIGSNSSISPFLNYLHSAGGSMTVEALGTSVETDEDVNPNILQFGLGFSIH